MHRRLRLAQIQGRSKASAKPLYVDSKGRAFDPAKFRTLKSGEPMLSKKGNFINLPKK